MLKTIKENLKKIFEIETVPFTYYKIHFLVVFGGQDGKSRTELNCSKANYCLDTPREQILEMLEKPCFQYYDDYIPQHRILQISLLKTETMVIDVPDNIRKKLSMPLVASREELEEIKKKYS